MKTNRFRLHRGALLLFAACMALAGLLLGSESLSAADKASAVPRQTGAAPGRLVIVRSASLGPTVVGLKVDGVQTARISYNRRYDEPIAAGSHVLTVYPVTSLEGAKPTETRINVQPGKTYTFTAARDDIQIVLK